MPKKTVLERSFLCRIKVDEKFTLEYVTVRLVQSRARFPREKRSFSLLFDMGKSYRLPHRITRTNGPFKTLAQAMQAGMDKLAPFMEDIAFLEYSFEHGVIEVGVVKTSAGFIAMATISGRTIFWTDESVVAAETIFAVEQYLYDTFKDVNRIKNGK